MDRHRAIYLAHPAPLASDEWAASDPGPLGGGRLFILGSIAALVALVGFWLHHWSAGAEQPVVQPWLIVPFALLLLSIATMPFVARHWWEHHYAKVAVALGGLVAAYYLLALPTLGPRAMAAAAAEYISFIYLLGSLFIVSGGILIRVRARATPLANVTLLLVGAILANFFGTTGASMLLIRPFLRMNAGHVRAYHVVFFIFIVSNAGGSLTPIGDPPLFLGYLQGVPFWWVLTHCWPFWVVVNGGLLALFFAIDSVRGRGAQRLGYAGDDSGPIVTVYGAANLIWIGLIVAGILLHDTVNHFAESTLHMELPVREWAMTIAAVASLATTPRRIHVDNAFDYAPIREVAFLFIGIFLTMVPALNYLHHASSGGSAHSPGQLYFASGTLSAVLDNAPTYLTFFRAELGSISAATDAQRLAILLADPARVQNLIAISMGAVLFGAMTYIGNGPNFMVKSVADHSGIAMPSFFGYLLRFAIPCLLPLLIIAWALFLRA